jgi:hypothetical protein
MLLVLLYCGELVSLIEFGAWFDLPWFEGELVICLVSRGSMVIAIETLRFICCPLEF